MDTYSLFVPTAGSTPSLSWENLLVAVFMVIPDIKYFAANRTTDRRWPTNTSTRQLIARCAL